MRKTAVVVTLFLWGLSLSACAGSNTGLALGYGHHGPGIAVFMDNLWATPHGGGISVPLGTESGSYPHAPLPAASGVSAAIPPARLGSQPLPPPGHAAPQQTLAGASSPAQPSAPDGASPSSSRLGETPEALAPPDLSYRP